MHSIKCKMCHLGTSLKYTENWHYCFTNATVSVRSILLKRCHGINYTVFPSRQSVALGTIFVPAEDERPIPKRADSEHRPARIYPSHTVPACRPQGTRVTYVTTLSPTRFIRSRSPRSNSARNEANRDAWSRNPWRRSRPPPPAAALVATSTANVLEQPRST